MPETFDYSVTVEAFGRVSTTKVEAASRREAEEAALRAVGFSVTAERSPIQKGVYVGPDTEGREA